MAAALEEGPPATSQPNTSEISQPSYSVIEDSIGQLVGCTNEKVIWPNRPLYGKYSLEDELSARKKSRRRARKKAPSKRESPVPSLRCMSSTSILGPAINPGSDVYHIPSWVLCSPKNSIDDSSSFEDIALVLFFSFQIFLFFSVCDRRLLSLLSQTSTLVIRMSVIPMACWVCALEMMLYINWKTAGMLSSSMRKITNFI